MARRAPSSRVPQYIVPKSIVPQSIMLMRLLAQPVATDLHLPAIIRDQRRETAGDGIGGRRLNGLQPCILYELQAPLQHQFHQENAFSYRARRRTHHLEEDMSTATNIHTVPTAGRAGSMNGGQP
jgi:hypothetical protein